MNPTEVVRDREDVEPVPVGLLSEAQQLRHVADAGVRTEAEDDLWSTSVVRRTHPAAPVERLAWLLPDPTQFDDDTLSELAVLLEDGDNVAASDLLRESEATVDAADVISAIEGELSELVPAEPGYDLVTTLHTSFAAAGP